MTGRMLDREMRRRGWTTEMVADRTGGEVSESAIRSYLHGQIPRRSKALTLAEVMRFHGGRLLRAWGYDADADQLEADVAARLQDLGAFSQETLRDFLTLNRIEYPGEPLTLDQLAAVRHMIRSLQRANQDLGRSCGAPSA